MFTKAMLALSAASMAVLPAAANAHGRRHREENAHHLVGRRAAAHGSPHPERVRLGGGVQRDVRCETHESTHLRLKLGRTVPLT